MSTSMYSQHVQDCSDLSWNINKLKSQNIYEVFELLQIARKAVRNTIQIQKDVMKLSNQNTDVLSRITICTQNIDDILRQLSMTINTEMRDLLIKLNSELKRANLESQLQNQQSNLNHQFLNGINTLHSIRFAEKTNLLNLIDRKFLDAQCDTLEKSKKVVIQKLNELESIMGSIFNNIDCLMLKSVHIIISAQAIVQKLNYNYHFHNGISLQTLKNSLVLYDLINCE